MRIALATASVAALAAIAVKAQPVALGERPDFKPTVLGVEAAQILSPGGAGPLYAILVRYAPGERSPLHSHPDARITTVLSGTFYAGGADGAVRAYPPGSIIHIPADTPHFGFAKEEAVMLQETGSGPTGTVIADTPKDPK